MDDWSRCEGRDSLSLVGGPEIMYTKEDGVQGLMTNEGHV